MNTLSILFLLTVSFLPHYYVVAQTTTLVPTATPTAFAPFFTGDCSSLNGCLDCVSAGCAWGIGTCFSSCGDIPEVPCYSTSSAFGAIYETPDSICLRQQQNALDAANCGIQTSCETCTTTALTASPAATAYTATDQVFTTCSWYEDRQACSSLPCDSAGCASPYCPSSPEGQCYFDASNCRDCLETTTTTDATCLWTGGSCELNCLADTTCYSPTFFVGSSNEEICVLADQFEADSELCSSQTDCTTCTATTKADGTSTCEWYYDAATGAGWCGLGGCDVNGLCGIAADQCSTVPVDGSSGASCAALAQFDPTDITCQACLDANCGWTGTQCLQSCQFLADASCFDIETPIAAATTTPTSTATVTPATIAPSGSTSSSSSSVPAICYAAEQSFADQATCSAITTCDICTGTLKSDRRSTCEWYSTPDGTSGYCGVGGCDSTGTCGSITCGFVSGTTAPTTVTRGGCADIVTCLSCLSDPVNACVWVGDTCQVSCNQVPGEQCYSIEQFPALTNSAICTEADFGRFPSGAVAAMSTTSTATMVGIIMGLFAMLV